MQARTIALTFHYLCRMKNIVFDLGGVVFGRDPRKWEPEFMEFFAFIHAEKMPEFWVDYDRGTLTLDEVVRILSRERRAMSGSRPVLFGMRSTGRRRSSKPVRWSTT